jgi:hypothetical protein
MTGSVMTGARTPVDLWHGDTPLLLQHSHTGCLPLAANSAPHTDEQAYAVAGGCVSPVGPASSDYQFPTIEWLHFALRVLYVARRGDPGATTPPPSSRPTQGTVACKAGAGGRAPGARPRS